MLNVTASILGKAQIPAATCLPPGRRETCGGALLLQAFGATSDRTGGTASTVARTVSFAILAEAVSRDARNRSPIGCNPVW